MYYHHLQIAIDYISNSTVDSELNRFIYPVDFFSSTVEFEIYFDHVLMLVESGDHSSFGQMRLIALKQLSLIRRIG